MFHPSIHLGIDVGHGHFFLYFSHNIVNKFFPGAFPKRYFLHQIVIDLGVRISQRQIVQLHLNFGYPQTHGNGRIDIHGLPGLLQLLFWRHIFQCPHIVKTVRQLNQYNPDILRHGQEHFPQILRLQFQLIRRIGQLSQFGHTVHQKRHLLAELLGNFFHCHPGILHRVMEKPCHNGLFVQFQICQYNRNAQGMNNIRLPGFALLPLVSPVRRIVCFLNQGNVSGRMVLPHTGYQLPVQVFRACKIIHGFCSGIHSL